MSSNMISSVDQSPNCSTTSNTFAPLFDAEKCKIDSKDMTKDCETDQNDVTLEGDTDSNESFEVPKNVKKKLSQRQKKTQNDITKFATSEVKGHREFTERRDQKIEMTKFLFGILLNCFTKLYNKLGKKVNEHFNQNEEDIVVFSEIRTHSIKDEHDEKTVKAWTSILYTTARKVSEVGFSIDHDNNRKINFTDHLKRHTVQRLVSQIENACSDKSPLQSGEVLHNEGLAYDLLVDFSKNKGKITRTPDKAKISKCSIFSLFCSMLIGKNTKNLGSVSFSMTRFLKNIGFLTDEYILEHGEMLEEKQQYNMKEEDFQQLSENAPKINARWVRKSDRGLDDDAFNDVIDDSTGKSISEIPVASPSQSKARKNTKNPISKPSNTSPKHAKSVVLQEPEESNHDDRIQTIEDGLCYFQREIDYLKKENEDLKEQIKQALNLALSAISLIAQK